MSSFLLVEPAIDLVTVMQNGIGEGMESDVFFSEETEENYRLNGGLYGQIGKGFHASPFVPIEEFCEEESLFYEEWDELSQRINEESPLDPPSLEEKNLFVQSQNFERKSRTKRLTPIVVIDNLGNAQRIAEHVALDMQDAYRKCGKAYMKRKTVMFFVPGGAAVCL